MRLKRLLKIFVQIKTDWSSFFETKMLLKAFLGEAINIKLGVWQRVQAVRLKMH